MWEANHVWLIFIFVVTWSAFPTAYESIWLTMFVPLTIAALGIVLRGASFAFRKSVTTLRFRRIFGGAFAISSVLVPFCMGAIAGGIASGQVPSGGRAGDPVHSWLNPTSLVTGVLAVAVAAYLAAVYLVWDARRADETAMVEYFRRRAVLAAVVAAVLSVIGLVVVHAEAPHVFDGLTSRALPVVVLSVVCGAGALVLLVRDAARGARVLAVAAVAGIIVAWGVAQWPYLLPETADRRGGGRADRHPDRPGGRRRRGAADRAARFRPAVRARAAPAAARRGGRGRRRPSARTALMSIICWG